MGKDVHILIDLGTVGQAGIRALSSRRTITDFRKQVFVCREGEKTVQERCQGLDGQISFRFHPLPHLTAMRGGDGEITFLFFVYIFDVFLRVVYPQ